VRQTSEKGASVVRGKRLSEEEIERRRRTALELNLGRMLQPGYHGPRWSEEQLGLLGMMTNDDVDKAGDPDGKGRA
jgi:hypothetical protein